MPAPALTHASRLLRLRPLHVAALLAALVLPLVLTGLAGGRQALSHLQTFPFGLLVLMLLTAVACWNLNALRLRLVLGSHSKAPGQREALCIELATKFALCATPGGSGGPITLLALLTRRGIPPAKGTATFIIDQGCDSLFFLTMLGVAVAATLWGEPNWPHQSVIRAALLGLGLALASAVGVIAFLPKLLRLRRLERPDARRRRWLIRRLLRCRLALVATLRLPTLTLVAVLLLTALHWILRYSLLYLAVIGVGGQADWLWTFLVQMLAMAASQMSFLPGGAGAAELGVGALLLPLMPQEQIAAAVLVWRLISYHLYLAVGAPVFVLLGARWFRRT